MMLDFDMGPARELQPLAVAAAARAIDLNPDLAETNLAFADIKYRFEHDWEAADAAYQRALSIAPHASIVLSPYSRFLCAAGRLDEGLEHARAGVDADPLSAEMLSTLAVVHFTAVNSTTRFSITNVRQAWRHHSDRPISEWRESTRRRASTRRRST